MLAEWWRWAFLELPPGPSPYPLLCHLVSLLRVYHTLCHPKLITVEWSSTWRKLHSKVPSNCISLYCLNILREIHMFKEVKEEYTNNETIVQKVQREVCPEACHFFNWGCLIELRVWLQPVHWSRIRMGSSLRKTQLLISSGQGGTNITDIIALIM